MDLNGIDDARTRQCLWGMADIIMDGLYSALLSRLTEVYWLRFHLYRQSEVVFGFRLFVKVVCDSSNTDVFPLLLSLNDADQQFIFAYHHRNSQEYKWFGC